MLANLKTNNKINNPQYDIKDYVLYFDHVKGEFDMGTIVQIQVIKTEQYQTIAYAIQDSKGNTLPCVPETLVFDDKTDANYWVEDIARKLDNIDKM